MLLASSSLWPRKPTTLWRREVILSFHLQERSACLQNTHFSRAIPRALAGITKDAATAGKMLTPWLILGRASANNRLERENKTYTSVAQSCGTKGTGDTREGEVTKLAGSLQADSMLSHGTPSGTCCGVTHLHTGCGRT